MTVAQVVGEPLLVNGVAKGSELDDRVRELLRRSGLIRRWRERYPHAFSGGQRQRIVIARAIALEPRLIIADEATSALDVSLRAQMLDLMLELQDELGLGYILISHDIGVIRYFCDRVAVMFRGRVVEIGSDRAGLRATRSTTTPRRCSRRSRIPIRAGGGCMGGIGIRAISARSVGRARLCPPEQDAVHVALSLARRRQTFCPPYRECQPDKAAWAASGYLTNSKPSSPDA